MISVIVPAHDEADTIERCLRGLVDGAETGELEVIVACNGCHDDTASRAERFGPPVVVVETSTASKRDALNLGDSVATGFPRFFVDADVMLTVADLRAVAAVLDRGEALVASPRLVVDVHRSSPIVRSYYRVFQSLPSVRTDIAGHGAYAVSDRGRERFDDFPDVTGDDHFIRSVFGRGERLVVDEAASRVVSRKARIHLGNAEVDRRPDGAAAGRKERGVRALARTVRQQPSLVVHLPAYALVGLAARVRARRATAGGQLDWGRDDSR
jgi:glycosyltransferase involved in cell wall biosynthesis